MNLANRAALITGGGTGVGRATALGLARRGCHVLVNYARSAEEAERTVGELVSLGVNALSFAADVADDTACRAMVDRAVAAFGRLDVLVNCAGTTEFIPFEELDRVTDELWQRLFAVNVIGAFHCARAARGPMLAGGGGAIVNVSSVAAQIAQGSSIPYCCSKAALDNLTVSLARTLAPHIRVNGVAPGFIAGRWLEKGLGTRYDELKQAFENALPLGHVCQPEDVADVIISLVDGSPSITGQTVTVDSGMSIAGFRAKFK